MRRQAVVRAVGAMCAALTALLLAAGWLSVRRTAASNTVSLLVTVAEVGPDHATIWVRGRGERAHVEYGADGGDAIASRDIALDANADHTAHVVLRDLAPATRFDYLVEVDGDRAHGRFLTAPSAADDRAVRFLTSGDLGGHGHRRDSREGYHIFDTMTRRDADFFLFLGDTVYADQSCGAPAAGDAASTLAAFHARHRYNREDPSVQQFLRSLGVYAIWDDHEVRNNFSGTSEPLTQVGLRAFQDYWAIDGAPGDPGRLYRRVRWGRRVELFILDTRQYRSPNAMRDGPGKTMLGTAQHRWLIDALSRSDATWRLVVTSVPLGIFTKGDSWSSANALGFAHDGAGFVYERDRLFDELRARNVANVVFLAGDVHHAQVLRHEPAAGRILYEVLAGPLAARPGFPRFVDRRLHSQSLASLGWTENFAEVTAERDRLGVRVFDARGVERFAVTLPPTSSTSPVHATAR